MTARRRPPKCKSCGAALLWVTTTSAKWMPLNADPDPEEGTVVLEDDLVGAGQIAHVLDVEAAARASVRGEPVYVPHFQTCPDADRWRKSRAS